MKFILNILAVVTILTGCSEIPDPLPSSWMPSVAYSTDDINSYLAAVLRNYDKADQACWGTNAPGQGLILLVKFPDVGAKDALLGWQYIKGWSILSLATGKLLFVEDHAVATRVKPNIVGLQCMSKNQGS